MSTTNSTPIEPFAPVDFSSDAGHPSLDDLVRQNQMLIQEIGDLKSYIEYCRRVIEKETGEMPPLPITRAEVDEILKNPATFEDIERVLAAVGEERS